MNHHLVRLDRWIARHGEPMELVRTVGTSTRTTNRVNCRGIVKTFGVEQLIGGLTQTNYLVILSPTDLRKAQWPGGRGPATVAGGNLPSGTTPPKDYVIPMISDSVVFRNKSNAIGTVNAIYDGDELIRIELKVTG